jgi:hypothetical protein
MNGNTDLSPSAQKAFQRIHTLQILSERTGFKTQEEQFKILISLSDSDCLAVAEVLQREKLSRGNGKAVSNEPR